MNSLLPLDESPDNVLGRSFEKLGTANVEVETLDYFCTRHRISGIDVLKIDTQGYDLNVLKGATAFLGFGRIGAILTEVNFISMYKGQPTFADLHGFLCSFGYRLVDLYNHARDSSYTSWCDALYVSVNSGQREHDAREQMDD